ncbi:MAG: hypothetical protein ACLFTQ_00185 [Candidatus Aenigmatarchaeota archaeon]
MFPFEGDELEDLIPPTYRNFLESTGKQFSVFQEVCEGRSYRAEEAARKILRG